MRFSHYFLILLLALRTLSLRAQSAAEAVSPVTVTAEFDPASASVGQKVFYRVNVTAAEAAIDWPAEIVTPPELKLGASARGQMMLPQISGEHPLTAFVYEVSAVGAGVFTVTNFTILANGQSVVVPAASVVATSNLTDQAAQRELALEVSATNLYLGQPFQIRLRLPAAIRNQVDFLREIRLNDPSLIVDKMSLRQTVQGANQNSQPVASSVTELTVTPITVGERTVTAQAFTAGRNFSGPVTITGQVVLLGGGVPKYLLLVSAPIAIKVRPLPATGELPGFTGALGKFYLESPQLATNRLRVGEPVHLKISFVSEGELTRFVPPAAPRSRDWQIIEDKPPATGFTLIPLTDEVRATPAIPFSSFDPVTAKYVNLTIPPIPVTVSAEGLPVQLTGYDDENKTMSPLRLSELATAPGKRVASLKPLQMQAGFVLAQLLPVVILLALWQWDRRRRWLEAHPEIVRRRKALRELRRKKNEMQQAWAAGETGEFIQLATEAMQIAVAPHFPAESRALVGGDVLAQFSDAERNGRSGEIVRQIFALADAQFSSPGVSPVGSASATKLTGESPVPLLLTLKTDLEMVLQKLEEKL